MENNRSLSSLSLSCASPERGRERRGDGNQLGEAAVRLKKKEEGGEEKKRSLPSGYSLEMIHINQIRQQKEKKMMEWKD